MSQEASLGAGYSNAPSRVAVNVSGMMACCCATIDIGENWNISVAMLMTGMQTEVK